MDWNTVGILFNVVLIPISAFASWYYARLRKVKRIYNNFLYFCGKHEIKDSKVTQEHFSDLIDEFEMSDNKNKFLDNIKLFRNIFIYQEYCKEYEENYKNLSKRVFWWDKFNNVKKLYDEYISGNLTEDKICKRFKSGMQINGRLINGLDKPNLEILNDIKRFVEDNDLRNLLMNLSINNHNIFNSYLEKSQYKNNVVFSNDFDFDNINKIIDKLSEQYDLYKISQDSIKKFKEKLSNKKIRIWNVVWFDILNVIKNKVLWFYFIMIPIIILLPFLVNNLIMYF
jgi:hypothetical protein